MSLDVLSLCTKYCIFSQLNRFQEGQMRPADSKSKLATKLKINVKLMNQIDGTPLYLADGGYPDGGHLMHKFIGPEGATYRQMF